MWTATASKLAAGLLLLTYLGQSPTLAAVVSSPYSPVVDPGVYPGGNINPIDGWTTLPSVVGAKIDNTSLVVGNGSATLVHYIDESYNASNIRRAVIQIHGENRDAWNQWLYADLSAKRAATGGSFDRDQVVVMAPMFFNTADEGAYPFDPSLNSTENYVEQSTSFPHASSSSTKVQDQADNSGTSGHVSRRSIDGLSKRRNAPPLEMISLTQAMIWKTVEWGDGSPCYEPSDAGGVGSFDALDAALAFFLNRNRFPQLRKVVVAGFSLGGQLTNRYATFRANTVQDNRVIYWVSSPNSFVYLQDTRPVKVDASCTTYNDYKYGLEGTLPDYYTRRDERLSRSELIQRFLARTIFYLCGSEDTFAGNLDCAANAQGAHHVSKMYHWTQQYLPNLPGSTGVNGTLPSNNLMRWVKSAGHEDWKIITSDPGVETLWLKEWYTNGTDAIAPPSNGVVAGETPSINAARPVAHTALTMHLILAFTLVVALLII